jgi:hypothetical protein
MSAGKPFDHISKPIFSMPTQRLQVGSTHQIRCQFAFNSRAVHIASNLLKTHGFLLLKRKVVVFRNLTSNIAVYAKQL